MRSAGLCVDLRAREFGEGRLDVWKREEEGVFETLSLPRVLGSAAIMRSHERMTPPA